MPLVDLKTDLKSIRFGSPDAPGDRRGGGWSNQPYITSEIPDNLSDTPSSTDFLYRGGMNVIRDSATDMSRLTKFFFDPTSSKGLLFTAKQELLSRTAVKLQAGLGNALQIGLNSNTGIFGLNGNETRSNIINKLNPFNAGVYNPLNTILQVGANAFGGHLNKQGLTPTSLITYSDLVSRTQSNNLNRLIHLRDNTLLANPDPVDLFSYSGGPAATLGVGRTHIRFADQRTGDANPLFLNPNLFFGRGGATLTGRQLTNQTSFRISGAIQDFRTKITLNRSIAEASGMLTRAPRYQEKQLETRVNLGDPGSKLRNRSSYTKGSGIVDAINGLYMYKTKNVNESSRTNDFVKFRFAVIDPDNPAQKTFVHFRSFFNGAITDNMNAQWDSFKYQGRGEDFFHYGGFSRDLGFSFTVVAQSREELSIMYQKLNYLQSTLAPNLSTEGYMRGNIHQVTIGGYLYEVPGVITSLNYSMPQDTTWEIGISDGGGFDTTNEVKELAHRIEVTVSFKPIHNFLPQTIKDVNAAGNIESRFISLANGSGTTNQKHNLYANGIKPRYKIPTKNDLAITELEFENLEFDEEEEFNGEFNFRNPLDDLNSEITRLENRDRG
tara:strand:+ start:17 stop:1843 length:1827 start_codon:yes stop_codon:yes gene_type:complete